MTLILKEKSIILQLCTWMSPGPGLCCIGVTTRSINCDIGSGGLISCICQTVITLHPWCCLHPKGKSYSWYKIDTFKKFIFGAFSKRYIHSCQNAIFEHFLRPNNLHTFKNSSVVKPKTYMTWFCPISILFMSNSSILGVFRCELKRCTTFSLVWCDIAAVGYRVKK